MPMRAGPPARRAKPPRVQGGAGINPARSLAPNQRALRGDSAPRRPEPARGGESAAAVRSPRDQVDRIRPADRHAVPGRRPGSRSLGRLMEYLAEHVAGYLVGGSVGEVPSLTLEERAALMRAAGGPRPAGHSLAVSISDNAIADSRILSDLAGESAQMLLMLSCPDYFADDRRADRVFRRSRRVRERRDLPVSVRRLSHALRWPT